MKARYFFALPVALLAFSSCAPKLPTEQTTFTKLERGVPGSQTTSVTKFQGVVTALNAKEKIATVTTKKGKMINFKAEPDSKNFGKVKLGDQFIISLTEDLKIRLAKPGEKASEEASLTVGKPPGTDKAGLRTQETVQSSAVITKIDQKRRKVTLAFADGSKDTFSVRDDIDLKERAAGETVIFVTTSTYDIYLK